MNVLDQHLVKRRRRRDLGGRWPVVVLFFLILVIAPRSAQAVIIFVKGQDQPIRGYLVRQTDQAVVLRQVQGDGNVRQRSVLRADIDDLIISVSAERLGQLKPENPDAYREYAEELAEKQKDPDARVTSIQLFSIAAHLAPERLGRSCLLGMIPLARGESEQRRFQAMAYLLDPAHDPDLLTTSLPEKTKNPSLAPERAQALLRALRLLRQGNKRDAVTQARRSRLKDRLAELTDTISYAEFENASKPVCPRCNRGYIECPECHGKKTVLRGLRKVGCPVCRGMGRVRCPRCGGNYRRNPIPPSLLRRIIQLELAWLPDESSKRSDDPSGAAPRRASWARAIDQHHIAPVLPLTLETLTEMDPRKTRYRDGQWIP